MQTGGRQIPFGIPRDLAVLAVAMLVWGLGEGLFIFFFPLSLQYWGLDTVQIGLVLGLIGALMAVVQVPAGWLSDRVGTRPLIRAALILGVLAALVMAAAQTQAVFVGGLLAYGLTSFIVPPINSYITAQRGNWSVQRAVTFSSAAVQVGAIAGPVLGGWIAGSAGLPVIFRYSAGLFLLATVVVFFIGPPAKERQVETTAPLASPLANPRFLGLLAVVIVTIFALNIPTQLASIYLQEVHGLSLQQIGVTGTVASIGTAVMMFALGSLRAPLGMLVGQLMIAALALLLWRGQSPIFFYAGYLFAGGTRLYRAMALAFARPLVRAEDVGLAYGLVETGNALAIILAPVAAGALYGYRPEAVFTAGLAMLAVTVGLNGLLALQKRKLQ